MRALGLIAVLTAALALAVLAAPAFASAATPTASGPGRAVFTETNAVAGNEIVAFAQNATGAISWVGNFSTGGTGTGASLADQGSLAITSDHHWLLAVDAGSSQISVFALSTRGGQPFLHLTDVVGSGGVLPVSLAIHNSWVYVLNDGSAISQGDVAGFLLSSSGHLQPLAGSTEPLSTPNATGAAQISFDPSGTVLVVSEKSTNLLDVYAVNAAGKAGPAVSHPSQGATPYGFAFTPSGKLVVSDATPGALSSYAVARGGYWKVETNALTDLQGAPCWVVITPAGDYAYTSNAHSNSISSYTVSVGGRLSLLQAVAGTTMASPTDLALTPSGHELYVYNAESGDLEGYHVLANGTLTWITTSGSLPASAEGLVAT
jgi:6-phosphogluconolactonase